MEGERSFRIRKSKCSVKDGESSQLLGSNLLKYQGIASVTRDFVNIMTNFDFFSAFLCNPCGKLDVNIERVIISSFIGFVPLLYDIDLLVASPSLKRVKHLQFDEDPETPNICTSIMLALCF